MSDKAVPEKAAFEENNGPLPAQWPIDDIAVNSAKYLIGHDQQFMPKIDLVYQPDGVPTELAINNQMAVLGKALNGHMSWISHFDSGKKEAYIDILGFNPNVEKKPQPLVQAAQGVVLNAAEDTTEDPVLASANNDSAVVIHLKDDAEMAVCNQKRLLEFTDLMHLDSVPATWVEAQHIHDNFGLGLPPETSIEDAYRIRQEQDQGKSADELNRVDPARDRRELRLAPDAPDAELESAQTKYSAMLHEC